MPPPAANGSATHTSTAPASTAARLDSVDLLRGLAIVLMALDHVRDYVGHAGLPAEGFAAAGTAMFLTRWVTHFCAPTFFLLAGMGAGIAAARGRPRGELARFLASRGLWLIAIEVTVVGFAWTFRIEPTMLALAVLWALGCSMLVLAGLVFAPRPAVLAFAVALIAGHNLLDGIALTGAAGHGGTLIGAPARDWLWAILHVQQPPVIYPLVPWVGVMALGFALAPWLLAAPEPRRRRFLALGICLSAAFVALRAAGVYGDPQPWSRDGASPALAFLDAEKYPPSLLFLLMTLGPALAALPLLERARGPAARFVLAFGRVPFFFYVAHLYLVHALAVALGVAQGFTVGEMRHFFFLLPEGYGFGLPVVYAAWVAVVLALHPACRWFAALKARRSDAWLRYL